MIDLKREELMWIPDICRRFKVCDKTVRSWFRRGLRSGRMGKQIVSSVEALQEFMQETNPEVPEQQQSTRRELESAIAALNS